MKAFYAAAVIGLGLIVPIVSATAQPYGGPDYRDRDRGDYRDRGDRFRGRDEDFRDRDRGYGSRTVEFDEREYMRCNPDVRRAVQSGQVPSAAAHYRVFGRREGRRLTC